MTIQRSNVKLSLTANHRLATKMKMFFQVWSSSIHHGNWLKRAVAWLHRFSTWFIERYSRSPINSKVKSSAESCRYTKWKTERDIIKHTVVELSSSQAATRRCLSSMHSFLVMGYSGLESCCCSIPWSDNVLQEWPHVKHHGLVVISPISLVFSPILLVSSKITTTLSHSSCKYLYLAGIDCRQTSQLSLWYLHLVVLLFQGLREQ